MGVGDDGETTRLRGGDALLAELERARTGEMLDIVATIQAEQDEIIRAPLEQLLTVQGGPGTGKTAVGLHRAAFLLYNYPSLTRDGVLVLGPSRAFLRYIAQVLPSLGEEAVVQTTIADIAPKAKVRLEEPMEVRRLKGDIRMAELLHRALHGRRQPLQDDVTLRVRFARGTLERDTVNELVDSIASRPAPYKAGRLALRARLVSEARRVFRSSARLGADEPWFEKELDRVRGLLLAPRHALAERVADHAGRAIFSRAAANSSGLHAASSKPRNGLCCSALARRPCRPRRGASTTLPLLDEAAFLTGGRSRSYGHIVVDEAQDLTPMQFRMIARRAPSGSVTILGDLAQATGPWTYSDWAEVRDLLPAGAPAASRRAHVGIPRSGTGARLRLEAPARSRRRASLRPPRSAPAGPIPPSPRWRRASWLPAALTEARALAKDHALVAVIAPEDLVDAMAELARRDRTTSASSSGTP